MRLTRWFTNFLEKNRGEIYVTDTAIKQQAQLAIEDFAIMSAIELIAGLASKCEFRTYWDNQIVRGREWYKLNYEPNRNQNASQFWNEVFCKTLYYNECLVVEIGDQLIIADDFSKTTNSVTEDVFTNVSRGSLSFHRLFKMSDVLYFTNSNSDIRRLISNLLHGYEDLLSKAVRKYSKSGGRKGTLKVDATNMGTPEFKKQFEELMNNRFKTYFDADNAVLPLFKGYDYIEQPGEAAKKTTSEINDISAITREATQKVAQGFKIPLPLLMGDIADVEKVTDNFLTFCIDPLTTSASKELVRKRYGPKEFAAGRYIDIDTSCIKHMDIFSLAPNFDKLIACGGYSINELRRKVHDSEIDEDWARRHWMTKNYQHIEMTTAEGGDM